MQTSAVLIQKIETLKTLPEGEHVAVWNGTDVSVIIEDVRYHITVEDPIRGMFIPCVVVVKDGVVTVKTYA